jgi:hypothetical protein
MKKRWFIIAGLLSILLAAGSFYYLYQKPRTGVDDIEAAHLLSAENIYHDFVNDEAAANQKYTGKVIEIRGVVSDVQLMDSTVNIFLAVGNDMGGINCSFKNNDVPSSVKGQEIKVKGRCTGFLIDVNLVDVVLIK